LIAALHEPGREQLLDLVRNPLRLTLLCMTWDGSSLRDIQADLYARYLRKVYEWNRNLQELRDHAKRCGTDITKLKQDLNQKLGELAKVALDLPGERFRLSQALVEKHLGEELDETSLGYLALRLGWLNRVGRDGRGDSIFAFYHATFQEYFAALALADWDYFLPKDHVDCPVAGKPYRVFEKQWKQVILLWLGRGDVGAEEKKGFINKLVNFETGCDQNGNFYYYPAYFLAAAAINEFKTCSLAAEIVRQVVKWGFGYFNVEKQEWWTFLNPIEERATKAIPETIRRLAITELSAIIENCPEEDTRRLAAEILGKIDPGNAHAIAGLLQVIRTTKNEHTRWQAAYTLGKIDPGNADAITGLLQVIRTTEDDLTFWKVAASLEEIGQGNPDVIDGLFEIIRTTKHRFIRWSAVETLGKIGKGNPDVIAGLLQIIRTTEDEWIRWKAAESLGKIDSGNSDAIASLLQVIHTTGDDWAYFAEETLGEIGKGNPDVIAGLLQAIRTTENESTRCRMAYSLGKIDAENPDAITGLLQIIRTTENEDTRWLAAYSLGKIGQGNSDAIAGLLQIIRTTEGEDTCRQAAESLGKIDPGNPDAIAGLVKIIRTTEDEKTRWRAAYSLGIIDPGNPDLIAGLLQIIRTTEDEDTRRRAVSS